MRTVAALGGVGPRRGRPEGIDVGEEFVGESSSAPDEGEEIIVGASQVACHACGRAISVSGMAAFAVVQCPHCRAHLSVPGKIGEFLLLKELGKGIIGATYRAFDRHLSRQVAVKVMRRSAAAHQQQAAMFLREAKAQASLDHPNIVQIYTMSREQERPYITMEFLAGGNLADKMQAGPMDEVRVLEIGIQVAGALKAAQAVALLHGDVHPGNILFEQETPKLVDFGLARFQTPVRDLGPTRHYIAPERLTSLPIDARSDIYSLGATLFHALSGRPPFAAQDPQDELQARLHRSAPGLLTLRSVHPATAVLIDSMLAGDPARRPQDYDALLALMRQTLERLTTPAAAPPPGRPKARPAVKRKKKDLRALLVILILVLVAVIAVIGIIFLFSSLNQPPPPLEPYSP